MITLTQHAGTVASPSSLAMQALPSAAAQRPATPVCAGHLSHTPGAVPMQSQLSDLFELLGQSRETLRGIDNVPISTRRVRLGNVLFHEGSQATHLHFVRVGAFKSIQTAEDGYEQVLSFCFKGETLGFDALCSGTHPCSAIALEDSTVLSVPLQELFDWSQKLPDLNHLLNVAVSRELTRRSDIAGMMAAVGAEVRLARFLLHLGKRMAAFGRSSRHMYLRMTRRDIASHLGVAHETVSRSFTSLADWGYIRVLNRDVEVLDPDGLRAFSLITRGLVDPHHERHPERHMERLGHGRSSSPTTQAGTTTPAATANLVSASA
jgi:CRP/FNR family transcriptional regulator